MLDVKDDPKTTDIALEEYLREIRVLPLLDAKEERELSERIERGDARAREKLIRGNLRLVVSIARKFLKSGLAFSDLLQDGNQGLLRAVEKFDHRRGYRFSTYAVWWIRQSILRGLGSSRRTIRIPIPMNDRLVKVVKTAKSMALTQTGPVSCEQIAGALGWNVERVRDVYSIPRKTVSLDSVVQNETGTTLGELIPDDGLPAPYERAFDRSRRAALESRISGLTPSEAQVIRDRFGLDGTEPRTLASIGASRGLTKERIRQIERKAILKLRASCGDLMEYY